ncbi:MAG: F0F1 ATP synthase subunit B [Solirubrobacteraceae bacterium]|nr:F0F1 ATP synthase subunit B [Solirubrobacteraceae bacterium]
MAFTTITSTLVLAAEGAEPEGGNFLVTPNVGLMLWTLLAFGITLVILKKLAFPRISEALDIRQKAIEDSISHAEQTRSEADQLLVDYRARLTEARAQADEILTKAKQTGDAQVAESHAKAKEERENQLDAARRDIEQATAKAKQDLRKEVADLTVTATEKITRRTLTGDDQQRLVDEALGELDFSALGDRNKN